VQHQDRVQAVLPDHDAGCSTALPDPSPPAAQPTNNCFKPYTPGTTPADLATTTTNAGATVPYIVRVERGTINRGIYDIAVLFDPTRRSRGRRSRRSRSGTARCSTASARRPASRASSSAPSRTGPTTAALSRGFMVVDHSLTDSLYNSNRVLVAETVMMMKEHIVDNYGEIKYTLGNGCSGGSIQQNTVSSIYPGLLDGIQPSCDYPDSITTGMEVLDCVLLGQHLRDAAVDGAHGWSDPGADQREEDAINGHLDHLGCQSWNNAFGFNNKPGNYVPVNVTNQTTGAIAPVGAPRNNCRLPAALVYDPVTNPTGTRCGDSDLATAVWGSTAGVAGSTRALQAGDNVGISTA
jgi:hypothetical protein